MTQRALEPPAPAVLPYNPLPQDSMKTIRYRETTQLPFSGADGGDAVALRIDTSRRVTLRFQLATKRLKDLEALRYARRAMIREERSRGLEWDEPSMEHLTFTTTEIRWFVLVSQVSRCREKIAELFERANRARAAVRDLES
jgi:hypothetical protein